jgi:hypothetical protein
MAMTEEEVALEVREGRPSRKEHAPRRVGPREERVLASYMLVERTKRRRKKNGGKSKRRSYPVHVDVPVRGELCA